MDKIPASESAATALAQQPDSPKHPVDAPEADAPKAEFKVAEIREDGTVIVEMSDGRMFAAAVKDGLEGVHKRSKVNIKADGLDKSGTPENPVIVKVL